MQGDTIVIEDHHHRAAICVAAKLLPEIQSFDGKYTMTVAGESGAGKSEIAVAIGRHLEVAGIPCLILQQDDYFIYPPKTNDLLWPRPADILAPGEVVGLGRMITSSIRPRPTTSPGARISAGLGHRRTGST